MYTVPFGSLSVVADKCGMEFWFQFGVYSVFNLNCTAVNATITLTSFTFTYWQWLKQNRKRTEPNETIYVWKEPYRIIWNNASYFTVATCIAFTSWSVLFTGFWTTCLADDSLFNQISINVCLPAAFANQRKFGFHPFCELWGPQHNVWGVHCHLESYQDLAQD